MNRRTATGIVTASMIVILVGLVLAQGWVKTFHDFVQSKVS